MQSMSMTLSNRRIAHLLEKNHRLIPNRVWSTVSGGHSFQGETLTYDGLPSEKKGVHTTVTDIMKDDARVVLWEPSGGELPPVGFPKSLHRGWTLITDGGELVLFQRVVFAGPSIISIPVETKTGWIVIANPHHVSAWDGTLLGSPRPAAS